MSQFIHQPHDKFFKQSMSNIQVAYEFFETYLPAKMLEALDLSTLSLQKETFIDEAYKSYEADVVYQVKIGQSLAYLYVLCEHQSEVDKAMAFRLLIYRMRIIELHSKLYPNQSLPIVYPLVIYTGERLWDAPMDIFELFGEQQAMAREIWLQPYQLIDVQRIEDHALREHLWSGLMQFTLKFRYLREWVEVSEILFSWLQEIERAEGVGLGKNVLDYLLRTLEANDQQTFIKQANKQLLPKLRGEAMTLAQLFEKQGFEKGVQEGVEQGVQQGMQQAMSIMAKNLLAEGLPLAKIQQMTGLLVTEIEALKSA